MPPSLILLFAVRDITNIIILIGAALSHVSALIKHDMIWPRIIVAFAFQYMPANARLYLSLALLVIILMDIIQASLTSHLSPASCWDLSWCPTPWNTYKHHTQYILLNIHFLTIWLFFEFFRPAVSNPNQPTLKFRFKECKTSTPSINQSRLSSEQIQFSEKGK